MSFLYWYEQRVSGGDGPPVPEADKNHATTQLHHPASSNPQLPAMATSIKLGDSWIYNRTFPDDTRPGQDAPAATNRCLHLVTCRDDSRLLGRSKVQNPKAFICLFFSLRRRNYWLDLSRAMCSFLGSSYSRGVFPAAIGGPATHRRGEEHRRFLEDFQATTCTPESMRKIGAFVACHASGCSTRGHAVVAQPFSDASRRLIIYGTPSSAASHVRPGLVRPRTSAAETHERRPYQRFGGGTGSALHTAGTNPVAPGTECWDEAFVEGWRSPTFFHLWWNMAPAIRFLRLPFGRMSVAFQPDTTMPLSFLRPVALSSASSYDYCSEPPWISVFHTQPFSL